MDKIQMIGTSLLTFVLLLSGSCANDDDRRDFHLGLNDYDLSWVSQYRDLARRDTLSGSDDSFVVLENQRISTTRADCQLDMITYQCDYSVLTLSFHSPVESRITYLTFYVFGNRKLVANYSDQSALEPEIFVHNFDSGATVVPQSTAFTLNFLEREEAFLVETIDTSSLFASLPPASFHFSRERGVTRWSDYRGNEYVVNP